METKYKRILIKLSGEALAGERGVGIDIKTVQAMAQEIQEVQSSLFQDLQQAFEQQDYESAAQWVRHGRFLNKLRKEIASIL